MCNFCKQGPDPLSINKKQLCEKVTSSLRLGLKITICGLLHAPYFYYAHCLCSIISNKYLLSYSVIKRWKNLLYYYLQWLNWVNKRRSYDVCYDFMELTYLKNNISLSLLGNWETTDLGWWAENEKCVICLCQKKLINVRHDTGHTREQH